MAKAGRARRAWIGVALTCAALVGLACGRAEPPPTTAADSSDGLAALALPKHAVAAEEGAAPSGDEGGQLPRRAGAAAVSGEERLPGSRTAGAARAEHVVAEGEGELPIATADRYAAAQSGERHSPPASDSSPREPTSQHEPDDTRAKAASDATYQRFAGSAFRVEQILRALGTSELHDLRPVGSTSVVLRANLDAPFRAALKLATRDRPLGAASEVAAYRLSRCLGLTTVPPAVLRHPPVLTLEHALEPSSAQRWPELVARAVLDAHSEVEAAAIFWVEGMRELPIATREEREPVMQALLQGSPVRADQQLMAAQLSDLSAFDLLLGNADRWSGSNVQGDASGQLLYIRDHDLSFANQPSVEARLLSELARVERFSRTLIEHVRALTPERIESEWNKDEQLARPERASWLRERVLPGIVRRRAKLLSHVQTLVFRYGEDAVLAFP